MRPLVLGAESVAMANEERLPHSGLACSADVAKTYESTRSESTLSGSNTKDHKTTGANTKDQNALKHTSSSKGQPAERLWHKRAMPESMSKGECELGKY
eukprot:1158905-Pelagomonas_calceolata.AAC.5